MNVPCSPTRAQHAAFVRHCRTSPVLSSVIWTTSTPKAIPRKFQGLNFARPATFAVYASQGWVAHRHAGLAFRRLASLTERTGYPPGPSVEVSRSLHPPSPDFAWRTQLICKVTASARRFLHELSSDRCLLGDRRTLAARKAVGHIAPSLRFALVA